MEFRQQRSRSAGLQARKRPSVSSPSWRRPCWRARRKSRGRLPRTTTIYARWSPLCLLFASPVKTHLSSFLLDPIAETITVAIAVAIHLVPRTHLGHDRAEQLGARHSEAGSAPSRSTRFLVEFASIVNSTPSTLRAISGASARPSNGGDRPAHGRNGRVSDLDQTLPSAFAAGSSAALGGILACGDDRKAEFRKLLDHAVQIVVARKIVAEPALVGECPDSG